MACCGAKRAGMEGREAKKCDDCRTWEEQLYWKRFQPLHFCQILGPGSEFHKQLVIPKKFADNARAILPSKVTLQGPSGASWYVIVTTRGDNLFLSDGWEEFVKAFSLEEGNILIFKYDGISVFDVLIFDGENLCEKEFAYFVKKCGHANPSSEPQRKRASSEADVEVSDDNHIHKAAKQAREEVGKNSIDKSPKRLKNSNVDGRSRRKKSLTYKAVSSKASPKKSTPLTSSENLSNPFVILAELGKSIVENATSNMEPENGTDINGSCATEAPNQNNAPQINGSISTEAPQDTPEITGSLSTKASLRSRKEAKGRRLSEATQKVASSRGRPKKAFGSTGKRKTSVSNPRTQTKASRKKAASSVGRRKIEVDDTKGVVPFISYDSSNRNFVSEAGKVALEMAHKQMTGSSFAVVMRPTSVHKRFIVTVPPAWFRRHLAPNSQDVFLRLEDKTWLTRLSYSPLKETGQICGGWKQFAQENQLEQFDVCLFDFASQKDDTVMLDVSIFRAGPATTTPPSQVTDEP